MNIHNINNDSSLSLTDTIVTVGMFDGVHAGHRQLLGMLMHESASRGLKPVVVTFDRHPRRVLHPETNFGMLTTTEERMDLIGACGVEDVAVVHFTTEMAQLTACQFVERCLLPRLGMKVLLLGYDNQFGSKSGNDFDLLPQLAERLRFDICSDEAVVIDGLEVSSTKVRERLKRGDVRGAALLLGRQYSVGGTVVQGRHVGRTMGFPTANMDCDDEKLLPAEGVYAAHAVVEGRRTAAMVNIGRKPTFGIDDMTVEAHLIDFDGDLYGKRIVLEFVERLRGTGCYATPEELGRQLQHDREEARRWAGC